MLRFLLVVYVCLCCFTHQTHANATTRDYTVVVYGATPAGIAAALAAADDGEKVLLIERSARIGGMVTSGLSHTDFRTFEGLSGTFLDFTKRVEHYYQGKYGATSKQVADSFRGTFAEPHVNLLVFQQMLAERKNVTVWTRHQLEEVTTQPGDAETLRTILSLKLSDSENKTKMVLSDQFIDGTYEGDLMAMAGVPWTSGREGRDVYGESLAPAKSDRQLQGYNFRFIMTKKSTNRVLPKAPKDYDRNDFLAVLPILESGKIKRVFGYPHGCIFKAHEPPLPNACYDINDVSTGLIRLSMPGFNLGWPDGDSMARERIFDKHLYDHVGLLYFLQHDAAVPKRFRDEALQWGWCKDEFAKTNHIPPQLYVREARRMKGQYVFTENDSAHAANDARSVLHTNAIACGDYGNNCHGTTHEGPRFGGKHTGEFYKRVPPYQIPYGVIVPKGVTNLLVPVAASSSHVGFCGLRLEPIWTSLGQAAGHAAHLARKKKIPLQKISVSALQERLHKAGSATVYVSDVRPDSKHFAMVQWWGTAGGFHGLAPMPKQKGQRGKQIHGQYFEAFPYHSADLDSILIPPVEKGWLELARKLGLPTENLPRTDGHLTRGEWLRSAYHLSEK